jgi:hypothetical protein
MEKDNPTPVLVGFGNSPAGFEGAANRPTLPAAPFDWSGAIRDFFLIAVISLTLLLAWHPGVVLLPSPLFLGLPAAGGNLAWRAPPSDPNILAERKPAPKPLEWRLASSQPSLWQRRRGPIRENSGQAGAFFEKLEPPVWRRFSRNPWNWRDDRTPRNHRIANPAERTPAQRPATSFHSGNPEVWPDLSASKEETAPGANLFPSLDPLPSVFPGIEDRTGVIPTQTPESATAPRNQPVIPQSETFAAIDWRTHEITGPIPGAYLTIYPRLRFVGLCVPGQGYVRKYQQVGVPADLVNPKLNAQDGRVPYGRYYLAERHRDTDGPRLFLSWPSPEDARRIGLDPGRLAQVDNAWRQHLLPPQDTAAGGGVGLNGLRNWVETTEGGFALEAPHMEEIFTALPDGAWVLIER